MKTETIISIFIVIGITFKYLLHWAGGNIMLILSISALSVIYFPLAFYFFSYKGIKNQIFPLSIIGGIALSAAVMGILFKIMYWPGSDVMLMIGVGASILIVVLSFILGKSATHHQAHTTSFANDSNNHNILLDQYYRNLQIRSCVIAAVGIFLFLTPTTSLVAFQYRYDPELVRLKVRSIEEPHNQEYKMELKKYEMSKY